MNSGWVEVAVIEKGRVIDCIRKKNILTKRGKEIITKKICGLHDRVIKYIQVGKGKNGESEDDTQLQEFYTEAEARPWTFYSYTGQFVASVLECIIPFSETVLISEAGLFDAPISDNPNMIARVTFREKELIPGRSMRIRWGIHVY